MVNPRPIERTSFGVAGGQETHLYTLTSAGGLVAKVTNFGATLTELHVPDRSGEVADVVLGFDSAEKYLTSRSYFGAIVGRVANRIEQGRFELEGKAYELARNDPPHHLHGGTKGFGQVVWAAAPKSLPSGPVLELVYVSPSGQEGYPGTLTTRVTYQLTDDAELRIDMRAVSDATTLVNLAHHSYFNLGGHGSGSILEQELWLAASEYTTEDPDPGVTRPVEGSPFDFREFKPIGRDLARLSNRPLGYDHNFIVDDFGDGLRKVAVLFDPRSGRRLALETDQPGLQCYCGSFLDGSEHGKGARYEQYAGLCLESQKFPYAINVPSWREQVILEAGETYRHRMVYRFSAL